MSKEEVKQVNLLVDYSSRIVALVLYVHHNRAFRKAPSIAQDINNKEINRNCVVVVMFGVLGQYRTQL